MEPVYAINSVPIDDFKHEPLDPGRRLIRLITVLSDLSKEGLLQCRLKTVALAPRDFYEDEGARLGPAGSAPSNIEDEDIDQEIPYTCLSYTWGKADRNHDIYLNGQIFSIRQNLWDFLAMARKNLTDQYFWIDALCIDQTNTKERNHQVQQMGNIYARASAVIVWLGCDLGLEMTLHAVNLATQERAMAITQKGGLQFYSRRWAPRDGHISAWFGLEPPINHKQNNEDTGQFAMDLYSGQDSSNTSNFFRDGTGKVEKVLENIMTHPYWSRAWVTQEVLLSRNALVVAGTTVHNLISLAIKFRSAVPYFRDNWFENLIDIFIKQRHEEVKRTQIHGKYSAHRENLEFETWGVVNLLHRFKNKNCAIRRDRIYSLLALCKEGAQLKVDYSVRDEQLMRQVLSLRESSMCFCSAGVVANALSPWEFETHEDEGGEKALEQRPFAQVHMYAYALTSAVCPFCSNWVPFSWTRKKGLVFCLGLACPDTQGHIFWEQEQSPCNAKNTKANETTATATGNQEAPTAEPTGEAPATATAEQKPGSFYRQSRQNNKSQLLCHENRGISVRKSEWPHVYQLQFTLRVLVEMLKEDLTTGDLGLNACGNLWPNPESKAASGLQRLQLCATQ